MRLGVERAWYDDPFQESFTYKAEDVALEEPTVSFADGALESLQHTSRSL